MEKWPKKENLMNLNSNEFGWLLISENIGNLTKDPVSEVEFAPNKVFQFLFLSQHLPANPSEIYIST